MTTNEEAQDNLKDKETTDLSAEDEMKKKAAAEAIEKNPDIEDPRLFSPLQEPDRPDSQERVSDEKASPGNPAD